jgi:cysteinyl-tRNA synthetase
VLVIQKRFADFFQSVRHFCDAEGGVSGSKGRPQIGAFGSSLKKWSPAGKELRAGLSTAKKHVLESLADDFHTPKLLSQLMELVTLTNDKMRRSNPGEEAVRVPPEIVWSVAIFISDTLGTLGFQTVTLNSTARNSRAEDGSVDIDELVDEFVGFRTKTKALALQALKVQKQTRKAQKKRAQQHEKDGTIPEEKGNEEGTASELDTMMLMEMCDNVRDEVFPRCGLSVQDLKGDAGSQWHWTTGTKK